MPPEGVDADSAGEDGMTALMWAAYKGDIGMLTLLVGNGASVEAKADRGTTALMMAAQEGNTEAVRLLLSHGSDPRIVDATGCHAQDYARNNIKHEEVMRILGEVTTYRDAARVRTGDQRWTPKVGQFDKVGYRLRRM